MAEGGMWQQEVTFDEKLMRCREREDQHVVNDNKKMRGKRAPFQMFDNPIWLHPYISLTSYWWQTRSALHTVSKGETKLMHKRELRVLRLYKKKGVMRKRKHTMKWCKSSHICEGSGWARICMNLHSAFMVCFDFFFFSLHHFFNCQPL